MSGPGHKTVCESCFQLQYAVSSLGELKKKGTVQLLELQQSSHIWTYSGKKNQGAKNVQANCSGIFRMSFKNKTKQEIKKLLLRTVKESIFLECHLIADEKLRCQMVCWWELDQVREENNGSSLEELVEWLHNFKLIFILL